MSRTPSRSWTRLGIERAVLVGICTSAWRALLGRGVAPRPGPRRGQCRDPAPYLTPPIRRTYDFETKRDRVHRAGRMTNRHYWLRGLARLRGFFFDQLLPEPHSTKQWEDCVGWALDIGPSTMLLAEDGPLLTSSREETEALLRRVRCPVLAIHGDADRCQPPRRSELVAEITGGELLTLAGAGHLPMARAPRRGEPGHQRVRAAASSHRRYGAGSRPGHPAAPGALPVLADRPRPLPPRHRDRRRTARAAPRRRRSTGWPSPR